MIDLNRIWPGWQIEELIGQGAYGKVYRIRRDEMGERYYAALKVIEIPADDAEVQALITMGMDHLSIRDYFEGTARSITNEIKLMESLKSAPNVVYIEEHYLEEHKDGIGWTILLRMELLESLRKYQRRVGDPDISETVKIGKNICDAITCCESKHIIHRDIKPENIFRNDFGIYKLGDFGIARQMENTKSAYSQKGTGAYMAPEVNRGEKYDHTVDIYSLGIMLYQFLNKQRMPFLPTDSNKITPQMLEDAQYRRLSGEPLPAPSDAPPALSKIILKACDPNPSRRYRNAAQFKEALMAWESGKDVPETDGMEDNTVPNAPVHWVNTEAEQKKQEKSPYIRKEEVPEAKPDETSLKTEPQKTSGNSRKLLVPIAAAAVCIVIVLGVLISRGNKGNASSGDSTSASSAVSAQADAESEVILDPDAMTYKEFCEAEDGADVTVAGVISMKSEYYNNGVSFYLQDSNGGYYVYDMPCTEVEYEQLEPGTAVKVNGCKAVWNGEEEIIIATCEIIEGDIDEWSTELCSVRDESVLKNMKNFRVSGLEFIIEPITDISGSEKAFLYGPDGTASAGEDIYFNAVSVPWDESNTPLHLQFCVETVFVPASDPVYKTAETLQIGDHIYLEGYLFWYEGPNPWVSSLVITEQQ